MIHRTLITAAALASALLAAMTSAAPDRAHETALAMESIAALDLGIREPATPDDYGFAAALLGVAHDLDPTNTELARAVAEAAWSSGDQTLMLEATRSIVRNDPKDTVAQLRLVSSIINRAQTVEERLKMYGRFTGQGASRLDPSVRSRLMLDAALLERDRGNTDAFERLLRSSARLDVSHKEAQTLLAQTMAVAGAEPSVRMRLQLKVLYADPLDAHTHHSLASMCAAEGAVDSAWRFLNNAINIHRIGSNSVPELLREQRLSLLWQYEGPESILKLLNPSLSDERKTLQAAIETRLSLDEPTDDLGDPLDIRFPPGTDRIRLLAGLAVNDQETVDNVMGDLQRGLRDLFEQTTERMQERGANQGRLLGEYLLEVVSLQTMRAIAGVDPDVIERDIDRIVERAPQFAQLFRPLEPFTLFVNKEYDTARQTALDNLMASAQRDLLIALSSDRLGDTDRAIGEYKQITYDYPLQAAGAYARSRLRELVSDTSELITEQGAIMADLERSVPEWVESMIRSPENTATLSVRPLERTYPATTPAMLEIELRNLMTIPIALGPTHPLDSDMLLIPGFRYKSGNLVGFPSAKVLDLGRRLRLEPREILRLEVPANTPRTRWLLRTQSHITHNQKWRALQGFRPIQGGAILNSPFSLFAETQRIERPLLAETKRPVADIAQGVRGAEAPREFILAAASALYTPYMRSDLNESSVKDLVEALWERYEQADDTTRAWMLCVLPTRSSVGMLSEFDTRVVESITGASLIDGDVSTPLLTAALVTRVSGVGSPLLELARSHDDNRIRMIAAVIEDRIDQVQTLYADIQRPFEVLAPRSSVNVR